MVRNWFLFLGMFWVSISAFGQEHTGHASKAIYFIAHRGGVVNEQLPENSLEALEEAIKRGYYMVELDMRLTRDNVLIAHHDGDFARDYRHKGAVRDMSWEEIKQLKGANGQRVLRLETLLANCQGKINVMIDNKIEGFHKKVFQQLLNLLEKYQLKEQALMIGTEASTPYFTGQIKLSCTRGQLEKYMLREDFSSSDYYLFSSNISKEDVQWAGAHDIMVVGAINAWALDKEDKWGHAARLIDNMRKAGVSYFQIDSMFEEAF